MSRSKPPTPAVSIALRITLLDPPPGIKWALQLGKENMVPPNSVAASKIGVDFTVDVRPAETDDSFRLAGPAVQGGSGARFVYLRSGSYAGQPGVAGWRAKVSLEGITRELIDAVRADPAGVLEVRIAGTAKDGSPAHASVPLLGNGWALAQK